MPSQFEGAGRFLFGTEAEAGNGFFGAEASRGGFTIPSGDVRDRYGEPRWVTFGWHRGEVVVLVYSSRGDDDHCISRRRAKI